MRRRRRERVRAYSPGMGGMTGFAEAMPAVGGSAPVHADAAKAWQGAVEEMTEAVTSQVKK